MKEHDTPPTSPMSNEDNEAYEIDDDEILEVIELNGENEEGLDEEGDSSDEENLEELEHAASFVDDADHVFREHKLSVFSCALSPKDGKVAVSGGQDDVAYVWDVSAPNIQVLFPCTGHTDSVSCTGFSHDGVYVATGDMKGVIKVWNVASKTAVGDPFEVGDLNWLQWHPGSHVLLAGTLAGDTWVWRIPSGESKLIYGHGERNECGKVMPDGKRVAVGYSDGSLKVVDLKSNETLYHFKYPHAEESPLVNCIDCLGDNNLVAAARSDGTTLLVNTQTKKTIKILDEELVHDGISIEAAKFSPDLQLGVLATASVEGEVAFWDISTQVCRQRFQQEAGISKLVWGKGTPAIYTAGLDGIIRLYDPRSGNVEGTLGGHEDQILDMDISKDGQTLLTASDDRTCRVFTLHNPST